MVQYIVVRVWEGFLAAVHILTAPPECKGLESPETPSEEWKTSKVLRTYHSGGDSATIVMVQTDTHAFHVSITLCTIHIMTTSFSWKAYTH